MFPSANGSHGLMRKVDQSSPSAPPPTVAISAPEDVIDAGLRSLDHYKRRLSPWRYSLRQALLPLIRWETPYLALMQDKMRSPALDSYFAITANLGTHTFFMIMLPILFWCGHTSLGRGMVHILASGVFFTGFLKDMASLPRPLSPPLHRITMSGSAALEYGFPSTHSANAVSVAVYTLFTLRSPECQLQESTKLILEALSYLYAFSIILGRLYCGMHGFVDVIVGSIMGAIISVIECVYGTEIDKFLHGSSWVAPAVVALVIFVLIRIHPEPADDCPCFDDSVSFAGVMVGIEIGGWHYANGDWAWSVPVPATVPFDLEHMGWFTASARILFGVFVIFVWKEVMKPLLLNLLPHLFRLIEKYGFILPRKFFVPASEYKNIPSRLKVDNVMPSISDIPSLLTSIRHPGRGRAVSVGPQSAADAYETLAYREKRRRDSLTKNDFGTNSPRMSSPISSTRKNESLDSQNTHDDRHGSVSQVSGSFSGPGVPTSGNVVPQDHSLDSYEQQMGQGRVIYTPTAGPLDENEEDDDMETMIQLQSEMEEKEMFLRIEKPRVRYDVEVVTKLIVYAGIAVLAVEVNPILFELIGLGMGQRPPTVR